ncbi:hypothetical protein SAMN05444274_104177 [Mariniphaga anaerophila]|uniref:Uncharacterized protein n=1 Tax=Mariniphaga anaerophila TaxID=1484053 RepID=A0A1M5A487_9BACT|nr:hypothetical protein [Mariniphaga anaerophila]SHF25025.1 hypothetical protein SAMN05444274_104177 [Mariniphaga anaerophila]
MKTFEQDKELKQLLKSVKLESPGVDFSAGVMNRVFAEQSALEKAKQQPLFGKGFWVIFSLFVALIIVVVLLSGEGSAVAKVPDFFPGADVDAALSGYRLLLHRLSNLPAGIAGILFGASLLILLENFLETRHHAVR